MHSKYPLTCFSAWVVVIKLGDQMFCDRNAFRFTEQCRGNELWEQHNDGRDDVSQVFKNVLSTGTRTYRLVVGKLIFFLNHTSNIFLCLRYKEYLVELIYGRSAMIRAPGRMDKVGTAAEQLGPVTGGSANPVAKTRTSGD